MKKLKKYTRNLKRTYKQKNNTFEKQNDELKQCNLAIENKL